MNAPSGGGDSNNSTSAPETSEKEIHISEIKPDPFQDMKIEVLSADSVTTTKAQFVKPVLVEPASLDIEVKLIQSSF